jgi:hypothetical protein
MLSVEFGHIVYCDYADHKTHTHRPAESKGPWFCSICGSTDHITWYPFFAKE